MDEKTIKSIRSELNLHARALGIPSGAADTFIDAVLKSTKRSLAHKPIITTTDLTRTISRELKKYHPDFAYVYENRDTII